MIVITGIMTVPPEFLDEFLAATRAMARISAEEDGCDFYGIGVEDAGQGRIVLAERWRDQNALDAHKASPHMRDFRAAIAHIPREANVSMNMAMETAAR